MKVVVEIDLDAVGFDGETPTNVIAQWAFHILGHQVSKWSQVQDRGNANILGPNDDIVGYIRFED